MVVAPDLVVSERIRVAEGAAARRIILIEAGVDLAKLASRDVLNLIGLKVVDVNLRLSHVFRVDHHEVLETIEFTNLKSRVIILNFQISPLRAVANRIFSLFVNGISQSSYFEVLVLLFTVRYNHKEVAQMIHIRLGILLSREELDRFGLSAVAFQNPNL